MNDLYLKFDLAKKFEPAEKPLTPQIDHRDQTATGLEWAKRQGQRPPEPEIKPAATIMPIAN